MRASSARYATEPVNDPTLVVPCGHDTCSECFTSILARAEESNIRDGREGRAATCPQCRGSLEAEKAITYSVFQKVYMPEKSAAAGVDGVLATLDGDVSGASDESDCDAGSESDEEANSDGDLRGFVVKDEIDDSEEEAGPSKPSKKSKKSKKTKGKGKMKSKEVLPHELKSLRHEASKNKGSPVKIHALPEEELVGLGKSHKGLGDSRVYPGVRREDNRVLPVDFAARPCRGSL